MKSRIKRFLKTMLKLTFPMLVFVVAAELLCSIAARWQYGTTDVVKLNELSTGNAYLAELGEKSWGAAITPHPYLGWVRNEETLLTYGERVNNVGLIGRDFPLERDPSTFTILLTGGSVAEQFNRTGHLERILNESGKFNKPVVVLNGATGSYAEPHQAIVTLLYGEVVDAIITIEMTNEFQRLAGGGHVRLEYPHNQSFLRANPVSRHGFDVLGAAWQSNELKNLSISWPSRAVFYATRGARQSLVNRYESAEPDDDTLKRFFSLPEEWSRQQVADFNIEQNKKYWRSIRALGQLHGFKQAHFLQPSPARGKVLTVEEKQRLDASNFNPQQQVAEYEYMSGSLLKMNDEGVPVFNLQEVFADVSDEVYTDTVHCTDHGYEIMARAITEKVIPLWSEDG